MLWALAVHTFSAIHLLKRKNQFCNHTNLTTNFNDLLAITMSDSIGRLKLFVIWLKIAAGTGREIRHTERGADTE